MSFLQKRIRLPGNREGNSRSWSNFIPCCVYLNTRRIQLPDDSDDEQLIDEQDTHNFEQPTYMPNNISIFKDQAPQKILSRNPFARAEEEPLDEPNVVEGLPKEPENQAEEQETEQLVEEELEEMAGGSGELMEFKSTLFTARNYDNEPDWTELHQDESDEEYKDDDDTQKKLVHEERIPQIEKEVLHMLPLTELSQDIPPNMIHRRPSYEKSMYGEEPLTSGGRSNRQSSSTNRFSQISFSSSQPHPYEETLASKMMQLDEESEHSASPIEPLPEDSDPLTQLSHTTKSVTQNIDQDSIDPLSAIEERRPSATIQSFLHDQMDSLGEGLAFIKKNLKMEEPLEEEDEDNVKKSNTVINKENLESSQNVLFPKKTRGSIVEVAGPMIARFMNHIQVEDSELSEVTELTTDEEDDLFDLTKIVKLGKNVRNFSEEFVGSSVRMLSDVANKVKTTVEQENQRGVHEEEESNENDWIHNYL
ncbi:hypothetical protein BY458DRAFT_558943 [Sporodiniella umbellata]|nr:hypothetical protein BY458DRAFT_558943 [Sporodiniella umbellata]